jgi:hypothetical protein
MATNLTPSAGPSIGLISPAFAYVGDNRHTRFAELSQAAGGLIFGGHAGRVAAFKYRREEPDRPILLDPAKYDPASKAARAGLLDPVAEEVAAQTELGVAGYLSPSPMTDRFDLATLPAIFEQGVAFARRVSTDGEDRPVFTTLVVTPEWLTVGLETLVASIGNHPHPIAFVPASYGDLFNDAAHVQGIVACLDAAAGAIMLRCDLSGIGLVAHGASAVGIGTTTGTRHRYLPRATKARRGDREGRPRAVLVSELLSFLRMDDLVIHEGDRAFECVCSYCGGDSLLRFADQGLAPEADLHTGAVWRRTLDAVLDHESELRSEAWRRICADAEAAFCDFINRTSAPFKPPSYLKAWQTAD